MSLLLLLCVYLFCFSIQKSSSEDCSQCGYGSLCVKGCIFIGQAVYENSESTRYDSLLKFCNHKKCEGSGTCVNTYGSNYCKCKSEVGQFCEIAEYSGSADEYAFGIYVYFPIRVPTGELKPIYISLLNTGKDLEIILTVDEKSYKKRVEDMINMNVAEICMEKSNKMPQFYDSKACSFLSNSTIKTLVVNANVIPELSHLGKLDDEEAKKIPGTNTVIGKYKTLYVEIRNRNVEAFNDYYCIFLQASPISKECFPQFTLDPGNLNENNEAEFESCRGLKFAVHYKPKDSVDIPCDSPPCSPKKFRCDSLKKSVTMKILRGSRLYEERQVNIDKENTIELAKNRFLPGSYNVTVRIHLQGSFEEWSTIENFYNEQSFMARSVACPLEVLVEGGTEQQFICHEKIILTAMVPEKISDDGPVFFQYTWICNMIEDICREHRRYKPSYVIENAKCNQIYKFRVQVSALDGAYYGEGHVTVYTVPKIKLSINCLKNCEAWLDPRELLRLEAVGPALEDSGTKWEIWKGSTKKDFSNLSKNPAILEIKTESLDIGSNFMIKVSAGGVNATFTVSTPHNPHKGTITVSPRRGYLNKTEFTFHFKGFRTYSGENLLYELREKDNENSPGKSLIASRSRTINRVKVSKKVLGGTATNEYGLSSEEVIIKMKVTDPDHAPDKFDAHSPQDVNKFLFLIADGSMDEAPPIEIANFLKNIDPKVLSSSPEIASVGVKAVNGLFNMESMSVEEKRLSATTGGKFLVNLMDGASNINCSKDKLEEMSGNIAETLGNVLKASISTPETVEKEEMEDDEQASMGEMLSTNLVTGLNKFLSTIGNGLDIGGEMKIEKKDVQMMVMKDSTDMLVGKEIKFEQGAGKFSLGKSEVDEVVILQSTKYSINPFQWAEINQSTEVLTVDMTSIEGKKKENVPIQLSLELKKESPPRIRGTVRKVSKDSAEHEKDLHVALHKFIPKEGEPGWGLIRVEFLRISSPIKVAALIDRIPDYQYIQINGKEINDTFKDFDFDANNAPYGSIFYIGIITEEAQEVTYSFRMSNAQCLSWAYMNWADTKCSVNLNSEGTLLNCNCSHMSVFSGKLFTPPNLINPIADIHLFKFILQNPYILIVVTTMACIVLMLLIWARIKDRDEKKMRVAYLLEDSMPSGEGSYLLGVYTGSHLFAGTTANVCIQVHGTGGKSEVHLLKFSDLHVLQVGQDDWFIFYTPNSLGVINQITLFHDDSGPSPDWYCKKIIIYDINYDDVYTFEIGQWISILTLDDSNQLMFQALNQHSSTLGPLQDKKDMVTSNIVIGMRNAHKWVSIFLRHPRAVFTRCQLIMSSTCVLSIAMIVSMMFFGVMEEKPEDLPKVEVTLSSIIKSIEAFIIAFPVVFIVLYFFEKAKKHETTTAKADKENGKRNKSSEEVNGFKEWLLNFIREKLSSKVASFPLLPVTVGQRISMGRKEKIWLAIAWTLTVIVTLTNCFFMVFYSLKFGKNKSLLWLYSFTVGWVEDMFFMEPLQIIVTSIILGFFLHRVASVDSYHFQIIDVEKNETQVPRRKPVVDSIYKPLTKQMVQEHLHIRQRADFMKWLYVRLLPTLVMFCLTFLLAWRSGIYGIHFEVKHVNHLLECPHDANGVCLQDIHSRSSFLKFLKTLQSKHCTMSSYLENHDPDFCNSSGSKLIGVPRLRQQRVRPNITWISNMFNGIFKFAHPDLNSWTQDSKRYFSGWQTYKKGESKSRPVWVYANYLNTTTASYYGPTQVLRDGGGYIMKLGQHSLATREKLLMLERYNWIDDKTRVIFFEMNSYNPHANIFIIPVLLVEQHASGVYTSRLIIDGGEFTTRSKNDLSLVVIASLFVVFYAQMLVMLFVDLSQKGFISAVREVKEAINVICIAAGGFCIFTWVSKVVNIYLYLKLFLVNSEDEFVSFSYPKIHDDLFSISLGVLSLFLALKITYLFTESFSLRYFRGFLFVKTTVIASLFIMAQYWNGLFTIQTEYLGCRSYIGLTHFLYDKKYIANLLKEPNSPAEYWLTFIFGYWFLLFKVFCVGLVICLHKEATLCVGAHFASFRYDLGDYLEKKLSCILSKLGMLSPKGIKDRFVENERASSSETEIDKSSNKKYFFHWGENKEKQMKYPRGRLLPLFQEIDDGLERRLKHLKKMNEQLDLIIKHIDETKQ